MSMSSARGDERKSCKMPKENLLQMSSFIHTWINATNILWEAFSEQCFEMCNSYNLNFVVKIQCKCWWKRTATFEPLTLHFLYLANWLVKLTLGVDSTKHYAPKNALANGIWQKIYHLILLTNETLNFRLKFLRYLPNAMRE